MRRLILGFMVAILTLAANGAIAQTRLPACPGSYKAATWTNCVGEVPTADGEKYIGEFKDGKFNGQGTYTFPSGEKYVGEWKDDKYNGQGIEYRADGSILRSGIWENDVFVRGQ